MEGVANEQNSYVVVHYLISGGPSVFFSGSWPQWVRNNNYLEIAVYVTETEEKVFFLAAGMCFVLRSASLLYDYFMLVCSRGISQGH